MTVSKPVRERNWEEKVQFMLAFEYPEQEKLWGYIKDLLAWERDKIINKIKGTQTKNEEGFYYQDLISKKQLLKELK